LSFFTYLLLRSSLFPLSVSFSILIFFSLSFCLCLFRRPLSFLLFVSLSHSHSLSLFFSPISTITLKAISRANAKIAFDSTVVSKTSYSTASTSARHSPPTTPEAQAITSASAVSLGQYLTKVVFGRNRNENKSTAHQERPLTATNLITLSAVSTTKATMSSKGKVAPEPISCQLR